MLFDGSLAYGFDGFSSAKDTTFDRATALQEPVNPDC
jgi:hypothetical protein